MPQGKYASPDDHQDCPPIIPQEIRNRYQDHGWDGEGLLEVIEYPYHFGHDEDQEKGEDRDTDQDQDYGIGQGGQDLISQHDLIFHKVGQPLEDDIQGTTGFPRIDHVGVEFREDLWKSPHGIRQGAPLVYALPNLSDHLLKANILRLVDEGG